jgi:mitochondrial fission protein ELM1
MKYLELKEHQFLKFKAQQQKSPLSLLINKKIQIPIKVVQLENPKINLSRFDLNLFETPNLIKMKLKMNNILNKKYRAFCLLLSNEQS